MTTTNLPLNVRCADREQEVNIGVVLPGFDTAGTPHATVYLSARIDAQGRVQVWLQIGGENGGALPMLAPAAKSDLSRGLVGYVFTGQTLGLRKSREEKHNG